MNAQVPREAPSLTARARDLAAALVARGEPERIVVVTSTESGADVAFGDRDVVWEPGDDATFFGFGEIARIDASGVGRFDEVRRRGAEVLAGVCDLRDDDATHAPTTRFFGGFAFRAEASRDAPWSGFGDASFTIPRVRFARAGGRAFLSVAMTAGEASADGAVHRALEAARAMRSAAAPPASGRARALRLERASQSEFGGAVRDALRLIDEGAFEKVVPMAPCRVIAEAELSPARALARLGEAYPTCTRFAFRRGGAVFLGASPETLVALSSGVARADALAGTARRGGSEDDDARAREGLLASDKNLREHAAVVRAVTAALEPLAVRVRAAAHPGLKTLRNVHHLHTPIEAELAGDAHVLDLVARLHPTPAVAGAPRDRALAWLASRETESRGWYAGPVGWFDAKGDGAFAVALRAGVVAGPRAWLYAGAGIVAGSDPDAEYAETRVKHAPMLDALEVSP